MTEGSETVFEWFRAVVDGDKEFPEADDDDADAVAARDVAVAIAARIADRSNVRAVGRREALQPARFSLEVRNSSMHLFPSNTIETVQRCRRKGGSSRV